MKRDNSTGWVIGLSVLCVGTYAMANGFRNPPAGAEAMGRSGVVIAQIDDPSAVVHNPANMTEMQKPEVMGAFTVINTGTDFHSPVGSASTDDPWKYLPSLFAVLPSEDHKYAAGVGVTAPFGQSTVWNRDGAFKYSAPNFASLAVVNVNPSIAVKLCDQVSVAAGLDVYTARLDMKQAIPWSMMTGIPMPDGVAHLKGDGQGMGGNAAVTYHPTKAQSLALTYRSPVKVNFSGDSTFSGAEALGLSSSGHFDSSMDFPAIVGLGYGIELTDTIRVEADVEWVEFSQYQALSIDAGNNNPLLNGKTAPNPLAPMVIPQKWKDSWTFGLGADWKVTQNLTLRAGYSYLESPMPDETLAPSLPDANQHVFTVGAGVRQGPHRFDLAYGYSLIADRNVTQDQNPAYNGKYETTSQLVSVSYGFSF